MNKRCSFGGFAASLFSSWWLTSLSLCCCSLISSPSAGSCLLSGSVVWNRRNSLLHLLIAARLWHRISDILFCLVIFSVLERIRRLIASSVLSLVVFSIQVDYGSTGIKHGVLVLMDTHCWNCVAFVYSHRRCCCVVCCNSWCWVCLIKVGSVKLWVTAPVFSMHTSKSWTRVYVNHEASHDSMEPSQLFWSSALDTGELLWLARRQSEFLSPAFQKVYESLKPTQVVQLSRWFDWNAKLQQHN